MTMFQSRSVSRDERRWVLLFAGLVMLITTIPYLIGYVVQDEAWRFSGFIFGVEDGNSYIAKMLNGSVGEWLFRTPYSIVPQRGVVAFLPYVLLGKLVGGSGIHDQLVVLYQFFRIGAGYLMILACYEFIAVFCSLKSVRRFGLILMTLGGGLGWVITVWQDNPWFNSMPLEYYSPESFGFLGIYGIPHLALARASLLFALVVYLKQTSQPQQKWVKQSIELGLLWLSTALAQPITAVLLGTLVGLHLTTTGLWQVWRSIRHLSTSWTRWRQIVRNVGVSLFIPGPYLIYTAFRFTSDSFLRQWTARNILPSPHPGYYLLAFGLVVPFSLWGLAILLRKSMWLGLFFAGWLLAFPFLAYAPLSIQRRLP